MCKTDGRCSVGLNLDGGIFGQYQRQPMPAPFLSVVSASNQKFGEPLLANSTNDYYEVLVKGAGHGDFSDMTFVLPFMKWLGANGPIESMRVVKIINHVSLQFFNAYLQDGPKPTFEKDRFPELEITTNEYAKEHRD